MKVQRRRGVVGAVPSRTSSFFFCSSSYRRTEVVKFFNEGLNTITAVSAAARKTSFLFIKRKYSTLEFEFPEGSRKGKGYWQIKDNIVQELENAEKQMGILTVLIIYYY